MQVPFVGGWFPKSGTRSGASCPTLREEDMKGHRCENYNWISKTHSILIVRHPALQDGVIPLKEKQLVVVRLGELPSWILMLDFILKALLEHFKEVTTGITLSISVWRKGRCHWDFYDAGSLYKFSSTVLVTRNSNMSGWTSTPKRAQCGGTFCIPVHDLCLAPLSPFIVYFRINTW